MRYLGVPLFSMKLAYGNCKAILDKVKSQVCSWHSKPLSFGGRLQLTHSILDTIYLYWVSVFVLPKRVTKELEGIVRNFL